MKPRNSPPGDSRARPLGNGPANATIPVIDVATPRSSSKDCCHGRRSAQACANSCPSSTTRYASMTGPRGMGAVLPVLRRRATTCNRLVGTAERCGRCGQRIWRFSPARCVRSSCNVGAATEQLARLPTDAQLLLSSNRKRSPARRRSVAQLIYIGSDRFARCQTLIDIIAGHLTRKRSPKLQGRIGWNRRWWKRGAH